MRCKLQFVAWATSLTGLAIIAGCPAFPTVPKGYPTCGEAVWNANNCLTCHGELGCGGSGPDIRDVTFDTVDAKLRDADTSHAGGKREDLSDQDIADLVAFLNSITDDDCALDIPSAPAKVANFAMITTHDPASTDYNANCTDCHGDRTDESALDGQTLSVHSVMPGRLGSGDQRCLTCHSGGVDFIFNTTSRLRDGMIMESGCASSSCHGVSGPVPFYATDQD